MLYKSIIVYKFYEPHNTVYIFLACFNFIYFLLHTIFLLTFFKVDEKLIWNSQHWQILNVKYC